MNILSPKNKERNKTQLTFGKGSLGLQSAGNISFNLSFSDFGLTDTSESERGKKSSSLKQNHNNLNLILYKYVCYLLNQEETLPIIHLLLLSDALDGGRIV